ncbi:MAG TPA: cytochrome c3 family protein [Verrucomicrobiae bacterium]|nr:cytochrome c3 family protein [Verrucomicrobiae bacterium]
MRRAFGLLWCLGAALGAAPFSHRIHLAQGMACADCHSAAAHSTGVSENLLPSKTVCLQCHTEAELPSPFPTESPWRRSESAHPPYELLKFSHALHLKMGDVAPFLSRAIDHRVYLRSPGDRTDWIRPRLGTKDPCQACHRGLAESDNVSAANMPQMADCLVCHSQIEAPFSCWDCHSEKADLRPPNHTTIANFMSSHSTGKLGLDLTTCTVCHGREFRCMGCH